MTQRKATAQIADDASETEKMIKPLYFVTCTVDGTFLCRG